jgi:PilZ domain
MNNEDKKERRKYERHPFKGEILIEGIKLSTIIDVSEGGLYVEAMQSCEENSVIEVAIPYKGGKVTFKLKVQYCQPGIGMGTMFIDLNNEQREIITKLIESIKQSAKPKE